MEKIENLHVRVYMVVMKKEGYSADKKFVEIARDKTCEMSLQQARTYLQEIANEAIEESLEELYELMKEKVENLD